MVVQTRLVRREGAHIRGPTAASAGGLPLSDSSSASSGPSHRMSQMPAPYSAFTLYPAPLYSTPYAKAKAGRTLQSVVGSSSPARSAARRKDSQ